MTEPFIFLLGYFLRALTSEPEFVNVQGAQESIPRNRFRQAGNRFLVSLKGLQIRAQFLKTGFLVQFVIQYILPIRGSGNIISPFQKNA